MKPKARSEHSCAYVVAIEKTSASADDLRSFSEYLSTLGVIGCEVIVLDASPLDVFEENRRVLRWVARHVAVHSQFDIVRTAADVAVSDRMIVAAEDVRCTAADVTGIDTLLDMHEVVQPQEYVDPLPWWGGIDAARLLVHRGLDPAPDNGATFAFRRSALTALRGFDATASRYPVRRMAAFGAEVFSAADVFVRRVPQKLDQWIHRRARDAQEDFTTISKSTFFFALLPAILLLTLLAGPRVAAGAIAMLAIGSIGLALRGRAGAAAFFPIRVCLFAPLWLCERSAGVYWTLASRLQEAAEPPRKPVVEGPAEKLASGE